MKRLRRKLTVLIVFCASLFLIATVFRTKINPLILDLARAAVEDAASNLITDSVDRQISEGNIQYSDLIEFHQDQNGNITALTTNMQAMNLLKTRLLKQLDTEIYMIDTDQISIPVGNLTGIQLLSGRGPELPVKIVTVSSSDASFRGEFSEAGINQTLHRIILSVSLDLLILLPSGTVSDRVSSDVCIAETVLIGPVPENYTYFYSSNAEDPVYFRTE